MFRHVSIAAFAAGLLFGAFAAQAQVSAPTPAPPPGSNIPGTMYASTCSVTVNSSTTVSTFCPVGTDPQSAIKRTYPAGYLVAGKSFYVWGGGVYTVPTGNTLSADVKINVGSSTVMAITTPAAPVGNGQGVIFFATCTVQSGGTTINCMGKFEFVVAGALGAPISFSQTNTFTPSVANTVDVTGDWNGTTTSQSTTVTEAVIMALN